MRRDPKLVKCTLRLQFLILEQRNFVPDASDCFAPDAGATAPQVQLEVAYRHAIRDRELTPTATRSARSTSSQMASDPDVGRLMGNG